MHNIYTNSSSQAIARTMYISTSRILYYVKSDNIGQIFHYFLEILYILVKSNSSTNQSKHQHVCLLSQRNSRCTSKMISMIFLNDNNSSLKEETTYHFMMEEICSLNRSKNWIKIQIMKGGQFQAKEKKYQSSLLQMIKKIGQVSWHIFITCPLNKIVQTGQT